MPVFSDPDPGISYATTYEQNGFLSNPDPGENLVSGNLVMETGCMGARIRGAHRVCASGVCIGVRIGGVLQDAHQGVHRYVNVVAASY